MLLIALALAAAACAGPAQGGSAPPPSENPPVTADPGAVEDRDPLPPTPVGPEAGKAGGSASGPSSAAPFADGARCLAGSECASGVCEGQGCGPDQPGTCMPAQRACTRDLRTYCGCNGETFQASGRCPGQRYTERKACGA